MLAGFELGNTPGRRLVESLKEGVDPRWYLLIPLAIRSPRVYGTRRGRRTVALSPHDAGSIKLIKLVIVDRVQAYQQPLAHQKVKQVVQKAPILASIEAKPRSQEPAQRAPLSQAEPFREARRAAQAHKPLCLAQLVCLGIQAPKIIQVLFGPPSETNSATAWRRSSVEAAGCATIVALVPTWIRPGAAHRSFSRRTSIATSAP